MGVQALANNHLQGKEAENHCVTTTKCINTSLAIAACVTISITRINIKFHCDVITRSPLQPINTSIDTFFSKLGAFLVDQRRRKKSNDG